MIHRGQLHLIDILSQVMQLIDSVIVILTKLYPIRIKNSVQHIVHAVVWSAIEYIMTILPQFYTICQTQSYKAVQRSTMASFV